jgi:hypothetical protein
LTYGRAKEIIEEWGWAERQRENEELEKEIDKYSNSSQKT